MSRRSAFTLIELLIVVAIIAILAAIAVPNFLEAQTRARVSRAHNDLRSIALAMESYRVDNNTYPAHFNMSPLEVNLSPHSTSTNMDNRLLTTPISYISEYPVDVFRVIAGQAANKYRLYAVTYAACTPSETYPAGYKPDYSTFPKIAWMTWSLGPDTLTNTGGYFSEQAVIRNEALAMPRIGIDKDGNVINAGTSGYYGMRYDSTNGTTSWGDIYRFDGEAKTRAN